MNKDWKRQLPVFLFLPLHPVWCHLVLFCFFLKGTMVKVCQVWKGQSDYPRCALFMLRRWVAGRFLFIFFSLLPFLPPNHPLEPLLVTSTAECWGSGRKPPVKPRASQPPELPIGSKWLALALHHSRSCLTSAGSSGWENKSEGGRERDRGMEEGSRLRIHQSKNRQPFPPPVSTAAAPHPLPRLPCLQHSLFAFTSVLEGFWLLLLPALSPSHHFPTSLFPYKLFTPCLPSTSPTPPPILCYLLLICFGAALLTYLVIWELWVSVCRYVCACVCVWLCMYTG